MDLNRPGKPLWPNNWPNITIPVGSNKMLICDTDLLVTKVYSEAYFDGFCDPLLEKYALQNTYDLYFLTGIDVPWVPDDLRDRPNERVKMLNLFKTALEKYHRTFVILEGNQEQRLTLHQKTKHNLMKRGLPRKGCSNRSKPLKRAFHL